MSISERLTYFSNGKIADLPGSEADEKIIVDSHKLDNLLSSKISSLITIEVGEAKFTHEQWILADLRRQIFDIKASRNLASDPYLFYSIVNSMSDWIENIFNSLDLTLQQKNVLRLNLFNNLLGRSGLSMLVEICSMSLAKKAGIDSFHFASGGVGEETEIYGNPSNYVSFYKGSEFPKRRTVKKAEANAHVACSFGKTSRSLIQTIEAVSESRNISAFLIGSRSLVNQPQEKAYFVNILNRGIVEPSGLIYGLADRISS